MASSPQTTATPSQQSPSQQRQYRPQTAWVKSVGYLIFFSRWLQAPLYLGLIIAQLVYVVVFVIELVHLIEAVMEDPLHIEESVIMLSVLGLIDVVMIANLLIMVIIGGYETFVSKIDIEGHPDQPEWLSHVNANVLKVKLAMAIIGISSIHLLKTFIEVNDLGAPNATSETGEEDRYTSDGVFWQVMIHIVFILSAIALAFIDRMSQNQGAGARSLTHKPSDQVVEPIDPSPVPQGAVAVSGYIIDGKFVEQR